MNSPKYYLIMNSFIILMTLICIIATLQPLLILGLSFLQTIPVIVNQPEDEDDEELEDAEGTQIGFHS